MVASRTVLHTEHFEPAVEPGVVQVASTAAIAVGVCAAFAVSVGSVIVIPHTEHFTPPVEPGVVQVAVTSAIEASV